MFASCTSARRTWDAVLGFAHVSQGVLYTVLAALPLFHAGLIPVVVTIPNGRPGANTTEYATETFFLTSPVAMVAVFMFLTGLFHWYRAFRGVSIPEWGRVLTAGSWDGVDGQKRARVINELEARREGDRWVRWVEYSITSSVMILVIALISGISELYALIGLVGSNVGMIFLGAASDFASKDTYTPHMTLFWCSSLVGLFPWAAIFSQVIVLSLRAGALPFVLAITISLFVLFFSFALNEWFYIRTYSLGKDQDLEIQKRREAAEFRYQLLSAVAKSLLSALTAAAMLT